MELYLKTQELPEHHNTTELPQNLSQDELRLITAIRKSPGMQGRKLTEDDFDLIIGAVGVMEAGSDYMKGFACGAALQKEQLKTI